MSDFDPARKLIMAKFKTVHGHGLGIGTPLAVVASPSLRAEVDEAMARRLWKSGVAVYAEDFRPTPVETKEQEAARLTAVEAPAGEPETAIEVDHFEVQDDLRVTNDKLRQIAADEGVELESDDNKADMQIKIMRARAARAVETDAAPDMHPISE